MFERIRITKKLKQRFGKAVSIVMSAAMLVTALPADMLGGIMSVKAAERSTAKVLDLGNLYDAAVAAGAAREEKIDDTFSIMHSAKTRFDHRSIC